MSFHEDPFGSSSNSYEESFVYKNSTSWEFEGLRFCLSHHPPLLPPTRWFWVCKKVFTCYVFEELGVDHRDVTTPYVWRHHAGLLMAISSPSAYIVFTIPTFLDALLGRLEASSLHACACWVVLHFQWSSICIASWLRNTSEKSSRNNEIQEFQINQRKEFETTSSTLWRHTRLGLVQESFLSLASFPTYCLAYWLTYRLKA